MAIDQLLDITLAVPDPEVVADFWRRHGLVGSGAVLGTGDRPRQLTLVEGAYRHLAELRLGCSGERDLDEIAGRIRALGIDVTVDGTTLTCDDPVFDHRVVVEVTGRRVGDGLHAGADRPTNQPGRAQRTTARADVVDEDHPRPPRRLGHVVLATPHVAEACTFYLDGLGFRVSDKVLDGVLTFMRIEDDHHNLLIQPASVSYLNHYAWELDDVDAIGAASRAVLAERPDADVVGLGRHHLGSNLFWYLTDPAGTMFEFFADMDQITDDAAWDREQRRDDWSPDEVGLSVWGPAEPPEAFFAPPDLHELGASREAAGRR
jgi:catechol 2,3-dioxygenase-like lactoylglutathione lyase family enzyme